MKSSTESTDKKRTLATLFGAGLAYNAFIDWLDDNGRNDGLTSLLVVVGVAYTVALSVPVIGMRAARWLLAAFAASGLPMIAGNVRRWWRREKRGR